MKEQVHNVNQRVAQKVKELRGNQALSLDALATKCGVSRSMISVVERGESSPTAVVLEKLAAGLGVSLASLFEPAQREAEKNHGPISRRKDQIIWKDPASGYVRRNVSPPDVRQPMQIVEVHFPPGARVAFESGAREVRIYQQIWMLAGVMEIAVGKEVHRLLEGDCLAIQLNAPHVFHNPTKKTARYAVVLAVENQTKR